VFFFFFKNGCSVGFCQEADLLADYKLKCGLFTICP